MTYQAQWTHKALKDLLLIGNSIADRITKKVDAYCSNANPLRYAKALKGDFQGLYRFRIGDYRAVFQKQADGTLTILLILRVKHRKDIYD